MSPPPVLAVIAWFLAGVVCLHFVHVNHYSHTTVEKYVYTHSDDVSGIRDHEESIFFSQMNDSHLHRGEDLMF